MSEIKITKENFENEVLKSDKPVLIDFWADWCGPCRAVAPIIEELAESYKGKVVIGKLDVDTNPEVSRKYEVMSIPTVILFNGGKEVQRQIGFGGKDAYVDMIKKVLMITVNTFDGK